MLIVPGLPPLQETTHSRELRRRVEQVVRDYQRDHPAASDDDVRTALTYSAPGVSPGALRLRRAAGVAIALLAAGVFTFMASTEGGTRFEGNTLVWRVLGGAAALAAVAIAAIRLARRG